MTQSEQTLMATLYALYLYECVFWAAPGERLWVRGGGGWIACELGTKSFTLLGRMPVVSDVLLLQPGLVRAGAGKRSQGHRLRVLRRRLDSMLMLTTLCRMQAIVLLLYIPALLVMHKLAQMWQIALVLVAVLHIGIVVLAAMAVRGTKKRGALIGAVVVNPIGAVRVMDTVAQTLWDTNVAK